jgi:hypothetical protein
MNPERFAFYAEEAVAAAAFLTFCAIIIALCTGLAS